MACRILSAAGKVRAISAAIIFTGTLGMACAAEPQLQPPDASTDPIRPPAIVGLAKPAAPAATGPATMPAGDAATQASEPSTFTSTPPDLEQKRAAEEQTLLAAGKAAGDITISNDCECGTPDLTMTAVSPNHIIVHIHTRRFLFQIHGVKGRTVRIDLTNDNSPQASGGRTNALFSYARDLSAPATYDAPAAGDECAAATAWNGAALPATNQQSWHFIRNVWNSDEHTISLVQTFDADDATVAQRVPRPASYNEKYFDGLKSNKNVKVIEVGRTPQNRPLLLARIGGSDDAVDRQRPCICVYGGEHADAADPMWAAQGAIDFLAGDSDAARQLRDAYTFLIIPTLDPDATAAADHSHIIIGFSRAKRLPENIAYANWFEAWVDKGNRIDVVLDLDGGNFDGPPADAVCYVMEALGVRGQLSEQLLAWIVHEFDADQLVMQPAAHQRGWSPQRLGGWLTRRFGTFAMSYGIDSQQPSRHLNVRQLRALGASLVASIATFLDDTPAGAQLSAEVDKGRAIRAAQLQKFRQRLEGEDAIVYEAEAAMADKEDVPASESEKVIP